MKIIFTLLFITTLSLFSFSQKKITSFYCGFTMSKWTGDANRFAEDLAEEILKQEGFSKFKFNNENRKGFTFGLTWEFTIYKKIDFQVGVFYSQKGTEFNGYGDYKGLFIEEKVRMVTNYAEIPLLFKLVLFSGKENIYFFGGPSVGYLVDSKMNIKVKIHGNKQSNIEDLENCNFFQVNLNVGAGVDFKNKVRLELKYDAGLSSVFNVDKDDTYIMKNGVISVCLAYSIN